MTIKALAALALLLTLRPARAEVPAHQAYWERVVAESGGVPGRLTAAQIFDPARLSALSPEEQKRLTAHLGGVMREMAARRADPSPELQALLASPDGALERLLDGRPQLRTLLWEAARSGAVTARLLDAFRRSRAPSLEAFLRGLAPEQVAPLLMPGHPLKEAPEAPMAVAASLPRAAAVPMPSVAFDAGQAYGAPGDRHVYVDGAGNVVALSVSTRRMPDGSLEDVLHAVNLNDRAAPRGATYSLRSDYADLQRGVGVSVGGVSFRLQLTADGDDHAITMSGAAGAFMNLKNPPEGPMSLSQLYAYRAARVFGYGRVVEFGGREYYVSPETFSQLEGQDDAQRYVGYGQLTYWPKDELDGLFAQRDGRDEVDPQTFDYRSLDVAGSAFRSVRDLRPAMAAAVIRREGLQDVASPRASLGQDGAERWWDAVLKGGRYVVEEGQAPAIAPSSDPKKVGLFQSGTPSDWSVARDSNGDLLVPAPSSWYPQPPGSAPGAAFYSNQRGDRFFVRFSVQDAHGQWWTTGGMRAFDESGQSRLPGRPDPQTMRLAAFAIAGEMPGTIGGIPHVFPDGGCYLVTDDSGRSLSSGAGAPPTIPLGVPLIWGTRFRTHKEALEFLRQNPTAGLEYLDAAPAGGAAGNFHGVSANGG